MRFSRLIGAFVFVFTMTWRVSSGADAEGARTNAFSMEGEWTFETVGEKGMHGQDVKALSQKFVLTFAADGQDKKAIAGKPFGFDIARSHFPKVKPGAAISFTTTYSMGSGGNYNIRWSGTLSKDGDKIEDGKFSFILGSGAFTAARKSAS